MADDLNPTPPAPDIEGIQSAQPPAAPAADGMTTAPAPADPESPPFSMANFVQETLRSLLHGAIGAAVGAILGFLIDMALWAIWQTGDVRLLTAGGLLLGVFFSGGIVRVLRLAPKRVAEAQPAGTGKAAAEGPPADSFREVVETVVFVVVLVLLLKSFDAEAFVIPTGSMAETLLGYQKMVTCPQCGYSFPVNCSQQVDPNPPGAFEWVGGCICPNCREHVRFVPHDDDTLFGLIPIGRTYLDPDQYPRTHVPRVEDKGGKQVNVGPIFPNEVADPSWGSGDRVLVAKFIYDLFDAPPDRLDVVVFKYPGDEAFPHTGPYRDGVPMNYIKRLVGLSGETIAIHDGDLYYLEAPNPKMLDAVMKADPNHPDAWHRALLDGYNRIAYFDLEQAPADQRGQLLKQLWEKGHMHVNEADAQDLFSKGVFQIIRKSPDNILSMRRIVYDNDHQAKDLQGLQPPRWADRGPNGGWQAGTETALGAVHNTYKLSAPSDDAIHWLGYRHLLRDEDMEDQVRGEKLKAELDKLRANLKEQWKRDPPDAEVREDRLPEDMRKEMTDATQEEVRKRYAQKGPELITDFMGYNTYEVHGRPQTPGQNWVGDLSLDCDVQADAAQGELTLELSKGADRFRAHFDLAAGVCTLVRVHRDDSGKESEETLDSKPTALKGGGRHALRFADVDQRLTVWVDEALPFGDGVVYKPSDAEGPTPENDLEPAGVGLKGTGATVRGLRLWRDTYYTTANNFQDSPSISDVSGVDFAKPSTWGGMKRPPTKTLYVQPKHFLCMGDNSPQSSDGRSWGLVPERLLLGKALAVYYPFDRFGRIR